MAVLVSPSLIVLMVSVDVNHTELELAEDLRSCVKVEVAVLGSRPPTVLMVSVEVKEH